MDILLNWLWHGCVVALAAALMLRVSRRTDAASRYRVWWAAAILVLIVPAMPGLGIAAAIEVAAAPGGYLAEAGAPGVGKALPAFVAAWTVWIAVLGSRAIAAFVALRRVRKDCRPFPAERKAGLPHWSVASRSGRPARLAVSDRVYAAAVLGVGPPVIAVAPRVLERLDDAELDQVLIHEWAHVQRYDELTNVGQLVIRILTGWHPAIWWIDRQLHREREAACDETAVRVAGSPKAYAACLAKLASLRIAPGAALAVPGALSASPVSERIIRVLRLGTHSTAGSGVTSTVIVALLLSGAMSLPDVRLVVPGVPDTTQIVPQGMEADRRPAIEAGPAGRARGEDLEARRGFARSRRSRARVANNPVPSASASRPPAAGVQPGAPATRGVVFQMPPAVPLDLRATGGLGTPFPSRVPEEQGLTAGVHRPDSIRMPAVKEASPDRPGLASPWMAVADAGAAAGRGSQKAAVTTAGFFNRFGRKMAGVF